MNVATADGAKSNDLAIDPRSAGRNAEYSDGPAESGGPVFVIHRRPGPGKAISPRDVCPDTGLARLSYGQARPSSTSTPPYTGREPAGNLHEYRHGALTHLGEQGASLLMLTAKSRHKKPENVRRYFRPPHEAISELTSLLAPGNARR